MLATAEEALDILVREGFDVQHLEYDRKVRCNQAGGKRSDKCCQYNVSRVHGTEFVYGYYGDFKSGVTGKFEGKGNREIPKAQQRKINLAYEKFKKEQKEFVPTVSNWDGADPCTDHEYLRNKGVKSNGLRVYGQWLLIPFYRHDGTLAGCQRISKDGKKLVEKGVKMKGAFHKIEGNEIYAICEGYATGMTIHEATGWTVVCAYACSNLLNVANIFKTKRMIICADNDHETQLKTGNNPGVKAGREVAEKLFCQMVHPVNPGEGKSDFNDIGVDLTKAMLEGKAPKSLLEQVEECEGKAHMEDFLKHRKNLIASYPSDELAFLKSRLKELGITKGYIDDIIKGIPSAETLMLQEESLEALGLVRFDGAKYHKFDSDRLYATTSQEISFLLENAYGEEKRHKQQMLDKIHRERLIGEVYAESIPFGRSKTVEIVGQEGRYFYKRMVSCQEQLETRLFELDEIELNDGFIKYIEQNYKEVIEIYEAALARKFCESKKAFVYLRAPTAWGKTFFFGLDSLSRSFTKTYKMEDFKGNAPDDFIKPLLLFIDEADAFPSYYKVNTPEYRRNYGALSKVKLGMRVMTSANQVDDLESGVDPQVVERVVVIKPKEIRLDHHGIERNLSQRMWEKYILTHLLELLEDWAKDDDLISHAQTSFEGFCDKYSFSEVRSHSCHFKGLLEEVMGNALNASGDVADYYIGNFNFRNYVVQIGRDSHEYMLLSPQKVIKEIYQHLDPNRYEAFRKQYRTLADLSELDFFDYNVARVGDVTKKGLRYVYDPLTATIECLVTFKNVTDER